VSKEKEGYGRNVEAQKGCEEESKQGKQQNGLFGLMSFC
jgi:hypothetical protein